VATREISESELGSTLTLDRGDELVLALRERPSTGYRWSVERVDSALLAEQPGSYEAKSGELGAPGVRRLVFVALAAGSTELGLKRSRGDKVDRRLGLKVAIRP
jgi:predicted secreted protein